MIRQLKPDLTSGKFLTIIALGGVFIISYLILFSATMIKLMNVVEPPFLLVLFKNWGAFLYIIPIFFVASSQYTVLQGEMTGQVSVGAEISTSIAVLSYLILLTLPVLAVIATGVGFSSVVWMK